MQRPLSLKNKMLSTPLLTKNPTPNRSRVISHQQPLNSTPINQLKLLSITNKENCNTSNFSPSPFNMNLQISNQNQFVEQPKETLNFRQSNCFSKTISFGDYKFAKKSNPSEKLMIDSQVNQQLSMAPNLSLIQAFNQKIKVPAELKSSNSISTFKSLKPHSNGKQIDLTKNSSQQKFRYQQNQSGCFTSLSSPQQVKQSNLKTDLKSSSSFSNLFEKRSITPKRLGSLAFGSLSRKANPSPNLKQSLAFKLESKQYANKIIPASNQLLNQSNFQNYLGLSKKMCSNNHAKTAKYRLVSTSECNQSSERLAYCSKCAIQLVQRGFLVQQINQSGDCSSSSPIDSNPNEQCPFGQSTSLANNKYGLSFKANYNSQLLEQLKKGQNIKQKLLHQISVFNERQEHIEKKCLSESEQIDCYYNSLISYIEQQKAKDKEVLSGLKQNIMQQTFGLQCQGLQEKLANYYNDIEVALKAKKIDKQAINNMNKIEQKIDQLNCINPKKQHTEILSDQSKPLLYLANSIQYQFDEFVNYFDSQGRLQFKKFTDVLTPKIFAKNKALRFSFEKALQQNQKKKYFVKNDCIMNSLQQQPEQQYEQNSFNQDNSIMQQTNSQIIEQKPFRTLFDQNDEKLLDEEEGKPKTEMYSPTFKSI